MNLFINAVSSAGMLMLFDDNRKIIQEQSLEIKGNESSKLSGTIDDFLTQNNTTYTDIDNIIVVHGPGSFTGVRAICLLVNTIAFSTGCHITPISYFDLFTTTPVAKQSSKRDMFFAPNPPSGTFPPREKEIQIIGNEDVVKYLEDKNIQTLYGEAPIGWNGKIIENIDYYDIIQHITFEKHTQIDPLYLKKPNIC